ncbi:hypothetical protein [Roseicyclus sp.]|uniref:hypothetical protein n=1 Tax=Roseicyclus sp. TaxID=1914329 RepID=UPI003F6A8AC7
MTRDAGPIAALSLLLEQQRSALLVGDVDELAKLPERLELAMHQLARGTTDPAALADLARIAARNARLMMSAREGLARAKRDAAPATPLTTYDAQGRKAASTPHGQLISRR